MKRKLDYTINSYEDLINFKQDLKSEISQQESEFKNNKFLKITSSVFNGESIKQPLFESISSIDLKGILSSPIANILSTFLMSNKVARKYFISFTIIKEMVPFAMDKIRKIINQKDSSKK